MAGTNSMFKMTATGKISCRMKKVYENKDCYDGDFINSMKHGFGLFTHTVHGSARYYEGEFANNVFSGYGVLTFSDPDDKYISYEGYFKHNLFHGQGVLTHRNGDVYTGTFQQDRYHGEGQLITSSSSFSSSSSSQEGNLIVGSSSNDDENEISYIERDTIYTGTWYKGYPKGKMKIEYMKKGDVYEGQIDRFYHGEGRIEYRGGELGWYEGEFFRGKQQGKGIRVYMNGNRYEGRFHHGQIHGTGTMMYANGDKYSGYWEEGYYNGEGVMTCHNGDKYEGTFCRGKFRGEGLFTYGNNNNHNGSNNVGSSNNRSNTGAGVITNKSNNTSSNSTCHHYLHHPPRHRYGSSTGTVYNVNRRKGIVKATANPNNATDKINNQNTNRTAASTTANTATSTTAINGTADGGTYDGDYKNLTIFHSSSLTNVTAPPIISSTGGSAMNVSRLLPLVDGQRHGLGHRQWLSGTEYYGEWKEGKMTGIGVLITTTEYNDNTNDSNENDNNNDKSLHQPQPQQQLLITKLKYEGGFLNGCKHGYGQEEFGNNHGVPYICPLGHRHCSSNNSNNNSSDNFAGTKGSTGRAINNNKLNTNTNKGITRYEGEYQQGLFHGQGVLECGDGRVYRGSFVKGQRHGMGKQTYVLAEDDVIGHTIINRLLIYTGEWQHNIRQGQGVAVYANGDSVQGLFENGQPHGKIRYTLGSENSNYSIDSIKNNNANNNISNSIVITTKNGINNVKTHGTITIKNVPIVTVTSNNKSNHLQSTSVSAMKVTRGNNNNTLDNTDTAAANIMTNNDGNKVIKDVSVNDFDDNNNPETTTTLLSKQVWALYKHGARLQWLNDNSDEYENNNNLNKQQQPQENKSNVVTNNENEHHPSTTRADKENHSVDDDDLISNLSSGVLSSSSTTTISGAKIPRANKHRILIWQ